MSRQREKAERFKALHDGDPFLIPNPWDAGSARVLEGLGFPALTTTSSGFAFTLGRLDGGVTLDELCGHVRLLDDVTAVPIAVDLENGYGPRPQDAAERIAAAHDAAANLDFPFMLVGRAENLIRGNPDLDDTIARLRAYEAAGADVLYAPGLRTRDEIRAVCDAVSKPVSVLALAGGLSVQQIVEAGAQRISVGGALAWAAAEALAQAAERIRDDGDFSGLGSARRIRGWLGG
jgi:2-methylisocitrate lyase-like PEP mutase family enzyme